MKKQHQVPIAAAVLLIIFAVATAVYMDQKGGQVSGNMASHLVRDYSPTTGHSDAKVTIVEFFDPACETCRVFHPFVKQLMAAYPGKIKLVLRYTPLHQGSDQVVALLEAARLQNKFWETLEAAYNSQSIWVSNHSAQVDRVWMQLGGVGLDLQKAQADMHSQMVVDRIKQDIADARQLQVTKTPGFFVNGKPLVRFGYEQLKQLVEAEVRRFY